MNKTFAAIGYGLYIAFLLWCAVSYVDIVADNVTTNPSHFSWNLFNLIIGK